MKDQLSSSVRIVLSHEQIAAFCRRNHIRKLSLFGSVLRDDFDDESDVDVLVEFEEGHTPDFFSLYHIERELSALLDNRSIDIVTRRALNAHLRDQVLASTLTIYAEN